VLDQFICVCTSGRKREDLWVEMIGARGRPRDTEEQNSESYSCYHSNLYLGILFFAVTHLSIPNKSLYLYLSPPHFFVVSPFSFLFNSYMFEVRMTNKRKQME
jgi:hypothetical protein